MQGTKGAIDQITAVGGLLKVKQSLLKLFKKLLGFLAEGRDRIILRHRAAIPPPAAVPMLKTECVMPRLPLAAY